MKFIQLKTIKYKSELNPPLKNSQNIYYERSGFIIKFYLDDYCGYGEASPLTYFSIESLKEVEWSIEELKSALIVNENYTHEELLNLFKIFTKKCPSLNFALDISLYDILAQKKNISLAKYLNPNASSKIKLSAINNFTNSTTPLKIKFGNKKINAEIGKLELIKKNNPNIVFRLDFNRMFDCESMIKICEKLKPYNIEYIEEPLKDPTVIKMLKLKKNINIPIALDETLITKEYKKLIEKKLIQYVILKASILGSVDYVMSLIDYFKKNNIKVIVSSSLQTQIGNLANINIAAVLNNKLYHGLNNHAYFDNLELTYSKNATQVDISKIVGLGTCWND